MAGTLRIKSWKLSQKIAIAAAVFLALALASGAIFALKSGWLAHQNAHIAELHFSANNISTKPVSPAEKKRYSVPPNDPRLLTIPSIHVSARVFALGAMSPNRDGSQQLDVPKTIADVGWYNCAINPVSANRCSDPKRPGDSRTDVADLIDGHSCEGYHSACVFDSLAKIKLGDKLTVERGDGAKITYVAKKIATVPLAKVDMSAMLTPLEQRKEGLNLISCAGDWKAKDSRGDATPEARVEVFAVRE